MMKIARSLPWLTLIALALLSLPQSARTAPPPERHPHIHAAVEALREAREELKSAAHDFCGHRAEALEQVDRAIKQLHEAEACAR
jgi:acyl-CoA reductase-like NAD-dependent aldehyde dehydrogenase